MGCAKTKATTREKKLLLLGMPGSGKTTIAKQLLFLYRTQPYAEEELDNWKNVLYWNILQGFKELIAAMATTELKVSVKNEATVEHIISTLKIENTIPTELKERLQKLWNDKGLRKFLKEYDVEHFQRAHNLFYCMENLERISTVYYVPEEMDILHARQRTTGIASIRFTTDTDTNWNVVDLGGQPTERRKWSFAYGDALAIIFCVAMDEFDQYSEAKYKEDKPTLFEQSIELFKTICEEKSIERLKLIIFMNKTDLFREKINRMRAQFKNYKGDDEDYKSAISFLAQKFQDVTERRISFHETCGLDQDNIRHVFENIKIALFKRNIENADM